MIRPSIQTPRWGINKMESPQINPQHGFDLGEYLDGLYSYAVVLSRNRSDAEDLVQETCLRAITGMNRLWPDSNVKSWLFTILRNVWLNHLRQRRAAPELVELAADESVSNSLADNGKDPHADLVSQFEREQVRAAIQQLSVEFREVILLREYEGLSYQEIASVLDCPPGTVMSRLARARIKLRKLLFTARMPSTSSMHNDARAASAAASDEGRLGIISPT